VGAAVAAAGAPGLSGLASAAVVLLVALVIHLLVAPLTGLVVVWERKISGRMQSRLGPNRVGPAGWLQWLADALKMLTKEDLVPAEADRTLFRLSPYLMWMSVFATFVVLPLSATAVVADMNVGLLYVVSVTSLTVIAILLGGWASNSKWSLLGGMRAAAQIVSYELPASLALLPAVLLAGTLSPQELVRAQGGLPHQWLVFANPLTFGCFFIYFVSALAEGNRAPFDLPEAESELVSGYNTEYSGFRFGIFSLAEWTNMYVMSALVTTVFLGGWNVPFVAAGAVAASPALQALGAALAVTKIVTLVFVIIWVRWTLPRLRIDQLMALCWKYLVPLSFAAFLGTGAWMWATDGLPMVRLAVSWATFLLGGLALGGLFVARVVANFRAMRLLHVGADRQFTWPFIDPGPGPARRDP
jgi:NADH-quinone oxidoreductase subunit H